MTTDIGDAAVKAVLAPVEAALVPDHGAWRAAVSFARGCVAALLAAAILLAAPAHAQTTTEVPSNWALIPSGLGDGDEFRLMFMTKNGLKADSTDIADYDAEVREGIERSGHAEIRDARYRDTFKVLGSTASMSARIHTGTTGSGGVPIYWLNGTKVADDYGDFYDGTWDHKGGATLQEGAAISQNRRDQFLCTGTDDDGTTSSLPMGASTCSGTMIETTSNTLSGETGASTARSRYLALSGVFRVAATAGDTIPMVEGLEITSDPGADEEYVSGDKIETTVTFSEAVSVTGTPRLKLKLDGKRVVWADYVSADSTGTGLVFSYTVKPSDYAHKGIGLPKNGIKLKGGTIKNQAGTVDANLDFKKQAKNTTQRVYVLPTVESVALASTPAADDTYRGGETITIDLTFDRDVLVVTDGGTPALDINVGTIRSRSATYTMTNGDFDVRFEYVVQPGDLDEIGISIQNNAIVFNGGRIIRKGHGDSVSPGKVNIKFNGGSTHLLAQPGHLVDATDPRGVSVSPRTLSVGEGSSATYTVVLDSQPTGNVTVTPAVSGDADVTVSPSALTFTPTDWSTVQTVTVSAAQDADAYDDTASVSHAVAGADYASVTAHGVSVTVTDDETGPGRVTGLSAEATARSVTLSWTAPADADGAIVGYRVEVSYDDGAVWAEVKDNTNQTSTTFSHRSGFTSGETRHYRVSAITDRGTAPASVAAVANATEIVPGLTATGEAVEDTPEGTAAINLCWEGQGVTLSDMSDFSIRKRMVHPSFSGDWGGEGWISLGVFEFGDCKEGVVGYRIKGSIASNVPYDFQFRARKGSGWALSNVAEGVSVASSLEVRADVVAGDSELSGDTIVPDTVCRDYDDPATPEDEEGAFIVNIGFTTKSRALLFYEEVSGFVLDDDLALENATAELIDRPYDYYLGYRVRITPTNWGDAVAVSVPAGAVTHAESSVSNQASNVFRRDTSDSTECAAGSTSTVYRARVNRAEILEDADRNGKWSRGERVRATLTFEEMVAVTTDGGVPSVSLDIDGETVQAAYVRGTGSTTLEFAHVVTQAQAPVREAELLEDSLALNGGAIASLNGPAVDLAHPGATNARRVSRSTPGPARSVTVADAEVEEGVGAELAFAVKLDGPALYRTTVDYRTSDGTATAGEDYTATSGTLSFAAGETSKTVSVPVLDDAHDEGSETLTLTLSNPSGAYLADGTATGTITNSDLMPRAWLARFGRTVADQVLDAVEERMAGSRSTGSEVTLAGQRLGGAEPDANASEARLEAFTDWLRGEAEDETRAFTSRDFTGRELLAGSSFALTGGSAGSGLGALWGRGAVSHFNGREGDLTLDGGVTSAMLGADWALGRGSAGVILSHSEGEGGYRSPEGNGAVESTLTGLYPWGRYEVSESLALWGVVGYGEGTLRLNPEGVAAIETDMDFRMAAVGGRGVLFDAPADGSLALSVTSDAMVVQTSSDEVWGSAGSLAASEAEVTRLRLGLGGTWHGIGSLEPSFDLGLRRDGGDAETGLGADIGAGLAWSDPAHGIRADFRARGLLTHDDGGFRERGFAGSLAWDPDPATVLGPSLTISQTAGAAASGGMDTLLSSQGARLFPDAGEDGDDLERRRLEAKLGYGWPSFGGRYTTTPEIGFRLSDTSREYIHAWRLAEAKSAGLVFGVDVEGVRREYATGDVAPEHRLVLGLGWRLEGPSAKDMAFELRFEGSRHDAANDDGASGDRLGVRLMARW